MLPLGIGVTPRLGCRSSASVGRGSASVGNRVPQLGIGVTTRLGCRSSASVGRGSASVGNRGPQLVK